MALKHITLQTYDGTDFIDSPAYSARNIKLSGDVSYPSSVPSQLQNSGGYSLANIISQFFINNEFFNDSDIQTGEYSGSGSVELPARIETDFFPNLIYIYGKVSGQEESGGSSYVVAEVYPKLGYGKLFHATRSMSTTLPPRESAHGLLTDYFDGITTIFNSYIDKDGNPVMWARLNEFDAEYHWVAFG